MKEGGGWREGTNEEIEKRKKGEEEGRRWAEREGYSGGEKGRGESGTTLLSLIFKCLASQLVVSS